MNALQTLSLLLALALPAGLAVGPAQAQTQTAQDLVKLLTRPAPLTRSMAAPAPALDPASAEFLKTLPTRGLTIEARSKVAEIAQGYDLPQVDIDILFDFNKDSLSPAALRYVITIGQALGSDALSGSRFVLAGHTDGVGGAAYNVDLSQRRAETVRRILIESSDIPAQRLVAVGFGFEQLKNVQDPAADENRRVELINLEVGWE